MTESLTFSVGQAVADFLATQSAVTTIVGTRIWQDFLPQGQDFPSIVLIANEDPPIKSMAGRTGLFESVVEVWSYGQDRGEAVTLSGTVFGVLDDLDKVVGERVTAEDSTDSNDSPDDGSLDYRLIRGRNYRIFSYRS